MTRECVTHHHACDCREAKFKELEAEVTRLKTGFQGACYTCETVGELNVRQEAELAELREALVKISKMDNLRVDYWNNEHLYDAVSVASAALLPPEVKDEQ